MKKIELPNGNYAAILNLSVNNETKTILAGIAEYNSETTSALNRVRLNLYSCLVKDNGTDHPEKQVWDYINSCILDEKSLEYAVFKTDRSIVDNPDQ